MKLPPISEMKEICIKKQQHPFYARLVIRKVAFYFAWVLLHFNITPNQATLMRLLTSIIGSFFLLLGQYKYSIIAVILFQLSLIFDSVDGQIARFTRKTSSSGHYFDRLAEYISISLIFVSLAFFVYNQSNQIYSFIFGFSASLSSLWFRMFTSEKYKIFFEYDMHKKNKTKRRDKTHKNKLESLKTIYDKTGFLYRHIALTNVITICAIFNILNISLIFYGITFPIVTFGNFIYEAMIKFKKVE